jgi:hypothetical protein
MDESGDISKSGLREALNTASSWEFPIVISGLHNYLGLQNSQMPIIFLKQIV